MVRRFVIVKLCLMLLTIATISGPIVVEEAIAQHKETKIVEKYQAYVSKPRINKEKPRNIKMIEHLKRHYNPKDLDHLQLKQQSFVQSRFFLSSYLES
ncbi:hypothetical protein V6C27_01385 [Peptococcaceae bacterium 1198_IL3148]